MSSKYCILVDWSSSGGKEIAVRVSHKGAEVDSQLKKIKAGLHVCSFTPREVGQHLVDVYVDGIQLPGKLS